jgi:hypothetical protein
MAHAASDSDRYDDIGGSGGFTMEKQNVDFKRLRRLAPGPFSESMLEKLAQDLDFANFHIAIERLELGDDPFTEELEGTFRVTIEGHTKVRWKGLPSGPRLYFTFTSSQTPDDNLREFQNFVKEHAITASTSPSQEHRSAGYAGNAGD